MLAHAACVHEGDPSRSPLDRALGARVRRGVRESHASSNRSAVAPTVPWLAVLSTRSVPRQGLGAARSAHTCRLASRSAGALERRREAVPAPPLHRDPARLGRAARLARIGGRSPSARSASWSRWCSRTSGRSSSSRARSCPRMQSREIRHGKPSRDGGGERSHTGAYTAPAPGARPTDQPCPTTHGGRAQRDHCHGIVLLLRRCDSAIAQPRPSR